MEFIDLITSKLSARFDAYDDLMAGVDDALLQEKIQAHKHKSLAEHLWCVVGARESYARAIAAGEWQGFACSMQSYTTHDFTQSLHSSADAARNVISAVSSWTPQRQELLATLAEHEVMHEGQIIRHMYALDRPLPASWVWA